MTKLFEELANEAWKFANENSAIDDIITTEAAYRKKFGELIVLKCVEILVYGEGNENTSDAIWDLGEKFDIEIDEVLDRNRK